MIQNHVGELMRAREWSIKRLAEKAGLDYGVAYRLVHARTVQFDATTLAKLCKTFGVGVGALLEYRDPSTDTTPSGAVD